MSHAVIKVMPADSREHYRSEDGILGRFSFPFTGNFDLTRYAHGALLVHNDDVFEPRCGVNPHRHAEMEIVTWVVEGSVIHEDTAGHSALLSAGMLQRMTAGTGLLHSELNPSSDHLARVVQMWVPPDTERLEPSYAQVDLTGALEPGDVVTALSGRSDEDPGIGIHNRWVALDIARPHPERPVNVAAAPFHHLFMARGAAWVTVGDQRLEVFEGMRSDFEVPMTSRWNALKNRAKS